MTVKKHPDAVGFPPPLLGEKPLRLPVAGFADDWLALSKPARVGVRAHPWDRGGVDLDHALNSQLKSGKAELTATGASLFGSVYYLEPEVSGVALFAKSRPSLEILRNAYGSEQLHFRFLFVGGNRSELSEGGDPTISCDAPLLPHRTKNKMVPSTAKGKKARTRFRLLSDSQNGFALWEATAAYYRWHQVRAHASVLGIPILGDLLYGGAVAPTLGQIMPKKRGPGLATPLFSGPALHLAEVRLPASRENAAGGILSPMPKAFRVLLKRLQLSEAIDQ